MKKKIAESESPAKYWSENLWKNGTYFRQCAIISGPFGNQNDSLTTHSRTLLTIFREIPNDKFVAGFLVPFLMS